MSVQVCGGCRYFEGTLESDGSGACNRLNRPLVFNDDLSCRYYEGVEQMHSCGDCQHAEHSELAPNLACTVHNHWTQPYNKPCEDYAPSHRSGLSFDFWVKAWLVFIIFVQMYFNYSNYEAYQALEQEHKQVLEVNSRLEDQNAEYREALGK